MIGFLVFVCIAAMFIIPLLALAKVECDNLDYWTKRLRDAERRLNGYTGWDIDK